MTNQPNVDAEATDSEVETPVPWHYPIGRRFIQSNGEKPVDKERK